MIDKIVFCVTNRCSIACRFCGPECNPRNKDTLDIDWIERCIDTVYAWGHLEQVIFTGGEPLLLGDDLCYLVRVCTQKDLLTRIVSNAYWARTPAAAEMLVRKLKDAGLTEINFSVDDFHQEHIPLEYIKNAVQACRANELPVLLAHKKMQGSKVTRYCIEEVLGEEIPVFDEQSGASAPLMISTGWTVPIGKGSQGIAEDVWMPDDPELSNWKCACSSVLSEVVITPRKHLAACCGIISPSVDELLFAIEPDGIARSIQRANSDFLINWLRLEGPYGIMQFVQKKAPHIPFHEHYVQTCHVCNDIFTREEVRNVLREHMQEMIPIIMTKRSMIELWRDEREKTFAGNEKTKRMHPGSTNGHPAVVT